MRFLDFFGILFVDKLFIFILKKIFEISDKILFSSDVFIIENDII